MPTPLIRGAGKRGRVEIRFKRALGLGLCCLAPRQMAGYIIRVRLILDNLPVSLDNQRDCLARCLEAMNSVMPLRAVYLFGSHARGDARTDSDVDLCIVADGATEQLKAAGAFRRAMRSVRPKPAFTLVPIATRRLEEKKANGDFFFATVFREGVLIAAEN